MNQTAVFCTGPGRVMLPGFTNAASGGPCILFLFSGFVVNSPVKYVLALFACFFMGFFNEFMSFSRNRLSVFLHKRNELFKIIISVLYGIQMINAYWMMLIVMTYEVGMFFSLIFGLFAGNFLFSLKWLQANFEKDAPPKLHGGTTPCCNHEANSQHQHTSEDDALIQNKY